MSNYTYLSKKNKKVRLTSKTSINTIIRFTKDEVKKFKRELYLQEYKITKNKRRSNIIASKAIKRTKKRYSTLNRKNNKLKVGRKKISAPSFFHLEKNHIEVLNFFNELYECIEKRKNFWIDIKPVKDISPAAALILASTFDLYRKIYKKNIVCIDFEEWDNNIKRKLYQLGIFELLEMPIPYTPSIKNDDDIDFIKFRTSTEVKGELASQLNNDIHRRIGNTIPNHKKLYANLTEAMQNSIDHAYNVENSSKPWWISGSYKKSNQKLIVMSYDQGVGIPKTLPNTHQSLLSKLLNKNDADIIELATRLTETQTGMEHRGKGLAEMIEFVDSYDNAKLKIYSNKGMFIHERKDGVTLDNFKENSKLPLKGTLIQWEISL